jgi:hypothetical protein
MSMWTHVCGIIRVDGLVGIDPSATVENIKAKLGPICLFDDWHDDTKLPNGSEGSLQYEVIEYAGGLPWLAIPIWGDLRDFADLEFIAKWWEDTLKELGFIRDAVLYAETEAGDSVVLKNNPEPL